MLRRALFAFALLAVPARAQSVQASYAAYAAGLNVVQLEAGFEITPSRYRVHVTYHTTGTFGMFLRAAFDTTVDGQFLARRAVPLRLVSSGTLRGQTRQGVIDYVAGQPSVRLLTPPNEQERELIPPERTRGTVDTLSAMAQLIRLVNDTGRCEGRVTTYDGRRLAELAARTVGTEFLGPSNLTSFTGNALHCDFNGRQLGGFLLSEDREALAREQTGSAWFAAVVPGGQMIPVRISFHTRWFGDAIMYITAPHE
jgi:hypothetical protein